jgi:hypothetical protein
LEHQKDASDGEDDEEETGDPSETEGVGEMEAVPFYLCRKDVKEEIVVYQHGAFQIRIRYSSSEDGPPYRRI